MADYAAIAATAGTVLASFSAGFAAVWARRVQKTAVKTAAELTERSNSQETLDLVKAISLAVANSVTIDAQNSSLLVEIRAEQLKGVRQDELLAAEQRGRQWALEAQGKMRDSS